MWVLVENLHLLHLLHLSGAENTAPVKKADQCHQPSSAQNAKTAEQRASPHNDQRPTPAHDAPATTEPNAAPSKNTTTAE